MAPPDGRVDGRWSAIQRGPALRGKIDMRLPTSCMTLEGAWRGVSVRQEGSGRAEACEGVQERFGLHKWAEGL